jgi:hypothetical protein
MLINCPDCDSEVYDLASACPRCARPIAVPIILKERQPTTIQKEDDEKVAFSNPFARSDDYVRKVSWLLLAAVAAALIVGAVYRTNSPPAPAVAAVETNQTPSAADEVAHATTKAEACTELASSADIEARRRDAGVSRQRAIEIAEANAGFRSQPLTPAQIAVVISEINLIHDNPQVTPAEVERRRFEGCMKSTRDPRAEPILNPTFGPAGCGNGETWRAGRGCGSP